MKNQHLILMGQKFISGIAAIAIMSSMGLSFPVPIVSASPESTGSTLLVIDEHQHPKKGEQWNVRFQTQGTSDLAIYPNDQATIDDADFVSLSCDDNPKEVTVLSIGDVIYAKNYSCDGISKISHLINKAGNHTLKFQFAGETAFAYNTAGVDWTALPSTTSEVLKFGADTANSVTYGGGKFVVVGSNGKASYSSDGITWTSLAAGVRHGH